MSERAAVAAREPDGSTGPDTRGSAGAAAPAEADRSDPPIRLGRKRYRYLALALSVLLALSVGGGSWYVRATVEASFPQTSGTLDVSGVQGRVEVYRSALGVPQVYASTSHDLFFAQGFVQAQDRFWQMDVYRHITAGRLSELFGAGQLSTDEFIRTMGWYAVAQQEYKLLAPSSRAALVAYSDGVNAYLKTHSGARASAEYALLGLRTSYTPYAWTPVDSIAWLKALSWDLRGNLQGEIDRSLATETLGVAQVDQLYPANAASSAAAVLPAGAVPAMTHLAALIRGLPSVLAPDGQDAGSNSWVVSGSLTTTGKPLLAADTPSSPELPSVWYQMGLHCFTVDSACPYDVAGSTVPGTPGVVIGHNESIAWGMTDSESTQDVTDLVLEKVTGNSYLYDGRRLPLGERRETIGVANGKPVTITVRRTNQGPLVSDAGRGYAIALRWTALSPGRTMDGLFELDRAENWNGFRAAARNFAAPSQGMVFADTAGDIGYQTSGEIPMRKNGDGAWPVPGWTDAYAWTGYIPFDELPHEFDPKTGYIVTANDPTISAGKSSYPLSTDFDYGYRADEITRRLERATANGGKLDATGMRAIEADDTDEFAATLVPYLEKAPVAPGTRAAAALFDGWDFRASAGSAAAAHFYDVWYFLLKDAFESKLPSSVDVDGADRWFTVVTGLLPHPASGWWTDGHNEPAGSTGSPAVEGRDAVLGLAMDQAARDMAAKYGADPAAWRWGAMHTLTVTDQAALDIGAPGVVGALGAGGAVDRLLGGGPIPVSGSPGAIDATGFDIEQGFAVDEAPSMRLVVDLADLDRSTWIDLTGESGHAGDPDHLDQLPLWQEQRTADWPFGRRAVLASTRSFLVLEP